MRLVIGGILAGLVAGFLAESVWAGVVAVVLVAGLFRLVDVYLAADSKQ